MDIKPEIALLIVGLVALGIFLFFRCRKHSKDGYMRSNMEMENVVFHRTPVDYAQKIQGVPTLKPGQIQGIAGNPHFITDPNIPRAFPLEDGEADFYRDARKVGTPSLWAQYGQWYPGAGKHEIFLVNDEKTRSLLMGIGDLDMQRALANMPNPRFGPQTGYADTEMAVIPKIEDPYKDHWYKYNGPAINAVVNKVGMS